MFYWMSYVKFSILQQIIINMHSWLFVFSLWLRCSLHFFLEIRIVIIVTKEKERPLGHPYQMRAKARIKSEIEEVQEQMKADMEAMKEQMTTMMEAMMSMRKMMEDNTATIIATRIATDEDPTYPSSFTQVKRPASNMVGQEGKELGSAGDPHFVHAQNKHSFPPYELPPNYTLPTVV